MINPAERNHVNRQRSPSSNAIRVDSINEILEAFDPLRRRRGAEDFAILDRILELYDREQHGMEGRGRRTRRWRFADNLAKVLVPRMMNKIKHAVQTRHKINYRSGYEL